MDHPIFQNDFFKDKNGQVVLWQPPNLPLMVGVASFIVREILNYGELRFLADLVCYGALFTWAWQEIFEGASPFRRCLGGLIIAWLVLSRIQPLPRL